jgi:hypothetical protein
MSLSKNCLRYIQKMVDSLTSALCLLKLSGEAGLDLRVNLKNDR